LGNIFWSIHFGVIIHIHYPIMIIRWKIAIRIVYIYIYRLYYIHYIHIYRLYVYYIYVHIYIYYVYIYIPPVSVLSLIPNNSILYLPVHIIPIFLVSQYFVGWPSSKWILGLCQISLGWVKPIKMGQGPAVNLPEGRNVYTTY
jgi:hypothetical protein